MLAILEIVLDNGGKTEVTVNHNLEARPLATWDDDNSAHPNLVWWSRLDGRYQVEVHRTGAHCGTLYIFDHANGDTLIYHQTVDLAYEAKFGPDVDDVYEWQAKAIEIVDGLTQKP